MACMDPKYILQGINNVYIDLVKKTNQCLVKIDVKQSLQSFKPVYDFYKGYFYPGLEVQTLYNTTAYGSGFIIEPNLIVTNSHVVTQGNAFLIQFDQDTNFYQSHVLDNNPELDISILTVKNLNKKLSALPLADDDSEEGESVLIFGHPLNLKSSFTRGFVVNNLVRLPPNNEFKEHLLQFDAQVQPGYSGGPVINSKGKVIAILTSVFTATNICFGVKTKFIKERLKKLKATGFLIH